MPPCVPISGCIQFRPLAVLICARSKARKLFYSGPFVSMTDRAPLHVLVVYSSNCYITVLASRKHRFLTTIVSNDKQFALSYSMVLKTWFMSHLLHTCIDVHKAHIYKCYRFTIYTHSYAHLCAMLANNPGRLCDCQLILTHTAQGAGLAHCQSISKRQIRVDHLLLQLPLVNTSERSKSASLGRDSQTNCSG